MPTERTDTSRKFLWLELGRFIAALIVVISHFQHFSFIGDRMFMNTSDPANAGEFALFFVQQHGLYAVQFFWLISGFIFYAQYAERIASRKTDGRSFFVARFSRLYPLHFVTMLTVLGAQAWYMSLNSTGSGFVYARTEPLDVVLHLFMASNWDQTRPFTINGPIWSVSQEVIAYTIFYFVARHLGIIWLKRFAVISPLIVLLLGAGAQYVTLYLCIALFFTGGGLFYLQGYLRTAPRSVKMIARISGISLAGLLGLAVIPQMAQLDGLNPFGQSLLYLLLALLVLALASAREVGDRVGKVFANLGSLTYSSYLIHFPLQTLTAAAFLALGIEEPWTLPWLLPAYLLVVFALAWPTYRYFEKPAQDAIRRRLLAGK